VPFAAAAASTGDGSADASKVDAEAPLRPKIAPAVGEPDDLMQIKGIGPKLNALLQTLGVTRFDQIAAWGDDDVAEVDQFLENFRGRVTRDAWIAQAAYLAKGDIAGFEAKFGKL
jgi:predicted flap endonuclease-1-like 5' DNA nuclease